MLLYGAKQEHVASTFNCRQSTVSRVWKQYRDGRRDFTRAKGQGRPRATTVQQDLDILRDALDDPFNGVRNARRGLQIRHNLVISDQTIRNHLAEVGIRSRRPCKRIILRDRHIVARLDFARRHRHWNRQHWGRVLFTDESRFHLFWHDGRMRLYRAEGERYLPAHIVQYDRYGGGSIMVWGE